MKINVEMTEEEYSDFMTFRSETEIRDELFDYLSRASSMFLQLFDDIDIKSKQNSLTIESTKMLQIVLAKCKFDEVLQGLHKALSKRDELGKIDDWYFYSYFLQLERICKGEIILDD